MLTVLAAQSAFEQDLAGTIRDQQGDWLRRHFLNMIHGVTPDLRFITWGDMQSGSNGGVTIQYAGLMDAVTWLVKSPEGAWMSRWLAEKRGLERFRGWTQVFYLIYTRNLGLQPAQPALSFLAGNKQAGHFMARSGWDDDATIVTFRCTDHYGDHNHHDQGSFIIYRKGLLAVDPPVYRQVRGPQQPTSMHNTLLIGGQEQRDCRGQTFQTIEEFEANRTGGPRLETGDILFYKEAGDWAAVAGQFAQAYDSTLVASCVRQLLFVRPGTVVVVDYLQAPPGKTLPPVQWLLQTPQEPEVTPEGVIRAANGASYLRLKPGLDLTLYPPEIKATEVKSWTVSLGYNQMKHGEKPVDRLLMVHQLQVGAEREGEPFISIQSYGGKDYYDLKLDNRAFRFDLKPPWEVRSADGGH
ncbi:MAG: heparinase II/III family protein [Candidatus Glassbacteria bacterium]